MSCSCDYGYDVDLFDCDPADIWRERRIASSRKVHKCCECWEEIPPGSRCCMATSLSDGKWWVWYRCVTCAGIAELVADVNKTCPVWGMLREACDETPDVDWHRLRDTGGRVGPMEVTR